MLTLPMSESAPPVPVEPWSLTEVDSTTGPFSLTPPWNDNVASAALMSLSVPVNVKVASFAPSPMENVRPVVPPSDSAPWSTERLTSSSPVATSTSATLRPVISSRVSSSTVKSAGRVQTGASLTAVIWIDAESVAVLKAVSPPLTVRSTPV